MILDIKRPSADLFRSLLMACLVVMFTGPAEGDDVETLVETGIQVTDDGGQPVPCCIYLRDAEGRSILPPELPCWRDHFCCDGNAALKLASGRYRYVVQRGPEHASAEGSWTISAEQHRPLRITLPRLHNLSSQGWYSGELHIHRPVEQIPLLLQASDLHVGPTITWWNASNPWKDRPLPGSSLRRTADGRWYDVLAGEDERGGGALLYFGLSRPVDITAAQREYPSSLRFLRAAKRRHSNVHVDIEKPFWRDVPLWLSSGLVDSMGIAHNHMWQSGVLDNEAWGRPRDAKKWPAPHGNALWSQFIYYQTLNGGLRVPPSAGSASGVLPNPVGYNRCYVHVDGGLEYRKWWEGLRAGRVFVTNGPLLLIEANDKLPGHVFMQGDEVSIQGMLHSQEPIAAVQLIRNGVVALEIPVEEPSRQTINFAFQCDSPGWFLIRAIASNRQTFRFASSGPFYVTDSRGEQPIDRTSAQFFLTWAKQRRDELAENLAGQQRDEVVADHDQAVAFWQSRFNESTP